MFDVKMNVPQAPLYRKEFEHDNCGIGAVVNIKGIKTLKVGINRNCTATIVDNDGNELEWENDLYGWNVVSNIDINYVFTDNKLKLLVDDESYIGSSFFVQVIDLVTNKVIGETSVSVIGIV